MRRAAVHRIFCSRRRQKLTMTSHRCFRYSVILLWLVVAGWTGQVAHAQSLSKTSFKANLDLPVSFVSTTEEDEDAPEVVELYGATFESDGFVFVGGATG